MDNTMKKCTWCNCEKHLEEFYTKKNGLHGRHAECKECIRKKNNEYKKKNVEKARIKDRLYATKINKYRSPKITEENKHVYFSDYSSKKLKELIDSLVDYGITLGICEDKESGNEYLKNVILKPLIK